MRDGGVSNGLTGCADDEIWTPPTRDSSLDPRTAELVLVVVFAGPTNFLRSRRQWTGR